MWQQLQQITTTMTDGAVNVLTAAGGFLFSTVQHLYMVIVKQQILVALQQTILGLLLIITGFMITKLVKQVKLTTTMAKWDKITLMAVLITVLVVLCTIGIYNLVMPIPKLFNPEYYAIQELTVIMKGLIQK